MEKSKSDKSRSTICASIKIMKKKVLIVLALFAGYLTQAQTPLKTAITDITLQCVGGTKKRSGIAYNPNQQLYYSVNSGDESYPIETFSNTGIPVASAIQGFDYRGVWWNTNTNVLEGNGYNNFGVWIQDLDSSFYALGTGINSISGVSGPDIQSKATYDSKADEILYYFKDSIYRYDRASHNLVTTIAVVGLPIPTSNLNAHSLAYTGITGKEIGLYDYVNKVFYFISKTTGKHVSSCKLPETAPSAASSKMGFANRRLWLYNEKTIQWESYITVYAR